MVTKCTNTNNQMITKESYEDLKEYWDYQRKVEYNREVVFAMADHFENRVYNDFGPMSLNEMKDLLWARVKSEDYEEPKVGWVPEDFNLRFEWEGPAYMPNAQLEKPKGRPVVLRAKKDFEDWNDIFDDEKGINNR
jgi:hypothetical protein